MSRAARSHSARRMLVHFTLLASILGATPAIAQQRQIAFDRSGYRLTSIGSRLRASARVTDARRQVIPNAPVVWRTADSSIAVVSADGVIESRRVGFTRLWAVSGRDSAFALILVDQIPVRLDFSPSRLRFEAVGTRHQLRITVRDASGFMISEIAAATACRSLNDRVAAIGPNGQIVARANGTTHLRCADRGIADSVQVEVGPRLVSAETLDKVPATAPRVADDTSASRARTLADSVLAIVAQQRTSLAGDTTPVLADSPPGRRVAADSSRAAVRTTAFNPARYRFVTVSATGATATRSSQFTPTVSESRTGMLMGGSIAVSMHAALAATADFRVGTLTAQDGGGEDMKVTEAQAQLTYWPLAWLGGRVGYTRRSESTDLVLHRWQFANLGAVTRFAFFGGAITTLGVVSILPWSDFTGHLDGGGSRVRPKTTSFAAEAGVEWHARFVSAGLAYFAERITFSEVSAPGDARSDQLSGIRVRLGVPTGR